MRFFIPLYCLFKTLWENIICNWVTYTKQEQPNTKKNHENIHWFTIFLHFPYKNMYFVWCSWLAELTFFTFCNLTTFILPSDIKYVVDNCNDFFRHVWKPLKNLRAKSPVLCAGKSSTRPEWYMTGPACIK